MRKVSILGSGNAAKKHREAFEQLSDLYIMTDYESADIIDICTPNIDHFSQAVDAVDKGKDVILEKPPCASLEQMDTLELFDELSGCGFIYPVFQYRDIPIDLGPDMVGYHRDPAYYSGWRGEYDTAFGGIIVSHMFHDISRIVHQYGHISAVDASDIRWNYEGVEVETRASINFYVGTKHFYRTAFISTNGNKNIIPNPGYVEYFRNLVLAPDLEETRHIMEVVTACYYSAFTGEPITLPLHNDHPFYSGWSEQMKQLRHKSAVSR